MVGRNTCHKDRAAQQSRGGTEYSSSEREQRGPGPVAREGGLPGKPWTTTTVLARPGSRADPGP